jgi:lysophospholipase L1-like esterase
MKRLKAISINLALMAGSLLLCVIVCEIALKIAGFGNLEIYQTDPYVYWRLKPNQDCFTKVDHRPVHVNAHATRGADFEVPKPPGVIRILSLGDSVTFGWGLSDDETYSHVLEKKLNEFREASLSAQSVLRFQTNASGVLEGVANGPKLRFEVINAGCNAWGYPQLKSFFTHYGLQWQPDYVIIAGANLWTEFTEEASPQFKKAMERRVFLKNLVRRSALYHFLFEREMVGGLYNRLRTRFIPIDPTRDKIFTGGSTNPVAFFEKHLREFIEIAQTNHVQPILLTIPQDRSSYTNETTEQVLAMRGRLAKEMNMPEVNLATGGWPPPGKSVYLEADYVHLTPGGNQDVAEKLTQLFSKIDRK